MAVVVDCCRTKTDATALWGEPDDACIALHNEWLIHLIVHIIVSMILCRFVARGLYRCSPVNKGSTNFAKCSLFCLKSQELVAFLSAQKHHQLVSQAYYALCFCDVLYNCCFFIGICCS